MIEKNKLLKALGVCLEEETRSLPFYVQYAQEPSFLAELPASDQVRIRGLLADIQRTAESHVEIYQNLIRTVEGADADAF